jgi:hypothetical protein
MKLVIVNDCAHVMQDLIPLLSDTYEISFLKRTRGLWSKTFGIALKILRQDGDIFHVNYALQDAYLVDKLKHHLDILHVHGSDIRWSYLSKKYHWMIKSNLMHAKIVLYSTPDLERRTKELRPDAIYLPNPVKTEIFIAKQKYNNPPRALYFKLSYEEFPDNLANILSQRKIQLDVLDRKIPYENMPQTLSAYDIFIDRMTIRSFSKTCLEAMSCGLATIDYRHQQYFESRSDDLSDVTAVKNEGRKNRENVVQLHSAPKIADILKKIYWTDSR